MKIIEATFGKWYIKCIPEDGARISVLQFEGKNLLTAEAAVFKPPERFYGDYETRPVYGYDDCFPTIDTCLYPGENFVCKDHGELCWQKWKVFTDSDRLVCYTTCERPNATFKRTLEFAGNIIKWKFEVTNLSDSTLPFLHTMHALMPLKEIS